MPPFILVGLAAGFASAVLFASATMGGVGGRLMLYFLAPLPAFLAGLGWGAGAAVIGALSTGLGCGLLLGPKAGLTVLVSQGLPVAVLCHLALLNRPGAGAAPPAAVTGAPTGPASVEWYPVGRLVAAASLMAGALAFLTIFLIGNDIEDLRKLLRELIEQVFLQQLPGLKDRTLGEGELATLTELFLYVFPAASALSWLGGLLVNLYLAGRITRASGRLLRPWPELAEMTYPRGFGLGLAAALATAALLTGYPALLASGFAGAFVFAFLLMGLAVVHSTSRGAASRPFLLWGTYLGLLIPFTSAWMLLALALLGILEPMLPFRRWARARQRGPE